MRNLIFVCLMTALFGLVVSDPVEARGGGAQAGSGGGGFSGGGRHFRGGGGRSIGFSGGGRHFRGGSHFGGGHRHRHRHSHFNIGLGYGAGFYGPGFFGYRPYGYRSYYRSPFYGYGYPSYYSRTVGVPSAPIVYVQREEVKITQPQTNYWHYCRNPEGYYPYIKKCPEGWLQVAPQPTVQ